MSKSEGNTPDQNERFMVCVSGAVMTVTLKERKWHYFLK